MKFILGFTALLMMLGVTLFDSDGELNNIGSEFFVAIESKDLSKVDNYLSKLIINEKDELHNCLQKNSLDKIQAVSWKDKNVTNNIARINGDITTNSKHKVSVQLVLFNEKDIWKIYSIKKVRTNKLTTNLLMPNDENIISMVKQTMQHFYTSIKQQDMQTFYDSFSAYWKQQITTEELEKTYAELYKKAEKYGYLQNQKPEIDFQSIIKDDLLLISGSYKGNKANLYFSQKYIYEICKWKLLSFEFDNSFIKNANTKN